MKKLLIGLLALGSISSSAGTLSVRGTNENVELNLDSQNNQLIVQSNSGLIGNKTILLNQIQRDQSDISVFAATSATADNTSIAWNDSNPGTFFVALTVPVGIVYDVVLLPFKGAAKVLKNGQSKKDMKKLSQAMAPSEQVEVSYRRFQRIVNLLK